MTVTAYLILAVFVFLFSFQHYRTSQILWKIFILFLFMAALACFNRFLPFTIPQDTMFALNAGAGFIVGSLGSSDKERL